MRKAIPALLAGALLAGPALAQTGPGQYAPVGPVERQAAPARPAAPKRIPLANVQVDRARDIRKTYILPEATSGLDTDLTTSSRTELDWFPLDIAYNLKVWHLDHRVACEGLDRPVRSLAVEGVHAYEAGRRAVVYYVVTLAEDPQQACAGGRLQLELHRLVDGEWYAPEWGRRLVKRR